MCAKTLCHCPIDFLLFAILGEAEVWRMSLSEGAADPKVFILVLGSPVWNDLQETVSIQSVYLWVSETR